MQEKKYEFVFDIEKICLLQNMAKKWDARTPPAKKILLLANSNDRCDLSGMTKSKALKSADLSISGVCFEISLYIFITYFFSMTNKDKKK